MTVSESLGRQMALEMAEQPRVLARLLARQREIEESLRSELRTPPAGIALVARGSSDNAAVFGRYLLEVATGRPVGLLAPSLWTRYESRADLTNHLVIALSQSGRTPEVERVLRLAASAGAWTLAITNEADSPVAVAAEHVVALGAGAEIAVPATKTFTAQLAAFMIVATAVGIRHVAPWSDLTSIPPLQEEVLADNASLRPAVERLASSRAAVAIGAGYLYPIALEAALKLIETTGLPVLAYSANDFLHGPVGVAAPDVTALCFASRGPVTADVVAAAEAARARGARVIWVSDDVRAPPRQSYGVSIPAGTSEPGTALLHAVRAQQLALELSRALGANADAPSGLRKITATA